MNFGITRSASNWPTTVYQQTSGRNNSKLTHYRLIQCRSAGAGPGGRISGSPVAERTRWRVTKKTAAVQVGTKSKPGTSSAKNEGRKAQCHPKARVSRAAASRSSAVSAGEANPGEKRGNAKICRASTPIATIQAKRCSGALTALNQSNILIDSAYDDTTNRVLIEPTTSPFPAVRDLFCGFCCRFAKRSVIAAKKLKCPF